MRKRGQKCLRVNPIDELHLAGGGLQFIDDEAQPVAANVKIGLLLWCGHLESPHGATHHDPFLITCGVKSVQKGNHVFACGNHAADSHYAGFGGVVSFGSPRHTAVSSVHI